MNRTQCFRLAVTLLISGFAWSTSATHSAWAQSVPGGLPGSSQNPGAVISSPNEQRLEQEQQRQQKLIPDGQQAPETRIDAPATQGSVEVNAPKIKADKLVVQNATLLSPQELQAITAPFEGKELTLTELQTVVDQINQRYREKGFLTTQVYIPPQDVKDGVVSIRVIEGRVGDICVKGNFYNRARSIANKISLESGDSFNLRDLEKDLNISNRFNDQYRLKATLSPGDETGETDIRLDVAERQPWQISPTFDNQGRPFIGWYRGGVELSNDSLFGFGDRLSTKYIGADGTNVALGTYSIPVSGRGDELALSYGYSRVDVDLGIPNQQDIEGTSHNLGLLFSHPFDDERVWVGDIGVNARRIFNYFNDDITDPRDHIRSGQLGLNFNKFDRWGRTFARLQTTVGITAFGGNRNFWKNEMYLTRLFNLPWDNLFMIRFYGQWTPDALPVAEQMQIGGAYSVRGYSEGLLLGDRGFNLTLEDRFPIPFLSHVSPWLNERLQGAVFYDIGLIALDTSRRGNVINPYLPGSAASERTLLMGTGLGLRARLTQYLQGFFDVGFGLLDRNNLTAAQGIADPTARIHFGVRSDLLPVDYRQRRDKVTCIDKNGQKKISTQPAVNTSEAQPIEAQPASAIETQTAPATPAVAGGAAPVIRPAAATFADPAPIAPVLRDSAPVSSISKKKEVSGKVGVMSILESK